MLAVTQAALTEAVVRIHDAGGFESCACTTGGCEELVKLAMTQAAMTQATGAQAFVAQAAAAMHGEIYSRMDESGRLCVRAALHVASGTPTGPGNAHGAWRFADCSNQWVCCLMNRFFE